MISVLFVIITSLGINTYRKKQTKRKLFLQTIDTEEKERRRYSQDLHDGLGPLLSSVNLYILNVLNLMKEEDVKEIKLLERANELLENAIDDTKSIANNLTPRVISECGLFTALKLFFEKINSSGKIEIIYTIIWAAPARRNPQPSPQLPSVRITSYNVCYTKLLRNDIIWEHKLNTLPVLGENQTLSYNFV